MTKREFLKRLGELRYQGWQINDDECLRNEDNQCPITAVAGTPGEDVEQALKALGMKDCTWVSEVVAAADLNKDGYTCYGGRKRTKYNQSLRIELLKKCGLL